uniref:Uncharacterized protein n=1 Tax=Ciona intestinalis TaxID=7719 RepID=H2XKN5_CIOIN
MSVAKYSGARYSCVYWGRDLFGFFVLISLVCDNVAEVEHEHMTAAPKSPILQTSPSPIKMLSGLISPCVIFIPWMYSNPALMSLIMRRRKLHFKGLTS